ncbi:MAG: alpha/beta hydrolase [Gemmatimonadetes bacterium]|nr:alpha/beta hydrolase [Gemmatimonadota bacterium]
MGPRRSGEAMNEAVTGWIAAEPGIQLRLLRWDPPAPRGSVLVVHGFGDHAGRYRDVARVLGSRGLAVAAYDQRGHGGSPGRRGDAPGFASFLTDLDRVWEHALLVLPAPQFLYGHSFGGLVVMRWVQTRGAKPRGVVLSAPWLATRLKVPRWKLLAGRVLLRVAPALTIASGSDRPELLTRDPARAAQYVADPLVHHSISARFHDDAEREQARALEEGWPDLPTLLVLPGDDRLVDAEVARRWAERHPVVAVLVRDGGRHELHNDIDLDQALGEVADWIEGRLAPEPAAPDRVLT